MKLLFDENLSPRLAAAFQSDYPGSTHVHLVGLGSALDDQVWDFARDGGFAIVTKDAANRRKSFLAAKGIRAYVELNEWQIREVQIALQEADAGDFARPSEVNKVFRNWRKPPSQW